MQYLMEEICDCANFNAAYKRVKANKGGSGVDGMTVHDLYEWLATHKDELTSSLLDGTYQPQPVKGVDIPKPGGGTPRLGIPTVVGRFVQQSILQVLTPVLDPLFSEFSYEFRPGRSTHDALRRAQEYVDDERVFVLDMDLEKFFDRVNHDILMARHVKDKRLLRIMRAFLNARIMQNGVCQSRNEGTSEEGPLSPLLANLLLDDMDKELERRGHCFCRYADDCNIYVHNQKAGERVLESMTEFLVKHLKLQVNSEKSVVEYVHNRKFLGYRILYNG